MNPQELASKLCREKMGGAEAAIVLALLFGPRRKRNVWTILPHHCDTLADALAKLVERGVVVIDKTGRHVKLALKDGENTGASLEPEPKRAGRTERTPARSTSLFHERPEDQQKQVLQRLHITPALLAQSKMMQEKAEALARQMFGK